MTSFDPYGGRNVVTSDPVSNLLAPPVDANYAKSGVTTTALNNKADASALTAEIAARAAALTAAQTALNARIDQTPYELESVAGAYPPRPNTPQHVHFMDPNVQPTFDGQLTGGGGMVPDWDVWWTGGNGVTTA
jgi:hypothetical protein